MFFRKKHKPYIKFIPSLECLEQYNPVLPAKDVLPDWWKKININQNVDLINNKPLTTGTIKRCPGIMDILRSGWVLRAWCDIYLNIMDEGCVELEFSDNRFSGQIHGPNQFLDHLPSSKKNYYTLAFKLVCPWFINTSPGYSVLYMDPFYYFNEYFDSAYGIQDTDKHHSTNVFLLIKKRNRIIIEKDTPLSIVFPFKREEIKSSMEPYDEKEIKRIRSKGDFVSYSKFSSLLTYKKEQSIVKSKCPFSFLF